MFGGASNLAEGVDKAFIFIFSVAFIFIIGITAVMIYAVIKFRRSKNIEAKQFTGDNRLEALWTIIPLILVLAMFWFGWMGFRPMREVPDDAMRIKAIGRMWVWEFDYGNGKLSDSLVVPLDVPVRLDLIAEDVNHSLFIPAFRVKEDVIPGYDNYLWFIPIYKGTFDLFCTEYCGTLHWNMVTKTVVVPESEFDSWLENLEAKGEIPDPEGFTILKENGCLACHSLDGSKLLGPSLRGFWGKERTVTVKGEGDQTKIANEEYIKDAIYNPNKEVVKGFSKGLMQSYEEIISEDQIDQIIEYLKTIDE